MKKILTLSLLILLSCRLFSQTRLTGEVIDPALTLAVIEERIMDESKYEEIIDAQNKINEAQNKIATLQVSINNIQSKTYKYLKNANEIINAVNQLATLRKIIQGINTRFLEVVEVVEEDPYLLLFASETEEIIIDRCNELFLYVKDIAFVWDDDNPQPKNLLNNAERMEIYKFVYDELVLIRADLAILKRNLLAAKKRSLFENLCPQTYRLVRNCEGVKNQIINEFHL